MRLCRFNDNRLGIFQDGDGIRDVSAALAVLPPLRWPAQPGDHLIRHLPEVLRAVDSLLPSAPVVPLAGLRYLSPIANPAKIVAAPLNYSMHVEEVGRDPQIHAGVHAIQYDGFRTPVDKLGLFLKASSSIVGASEGIHLTYPDRRTDHEVELVAVIGREAKNVDEKDALNYLCGYCIGLDMTVRGPEDRSFRKSPDSYTVLGPLLVTVDEIRDPGQLDLSITVNGETRQSGNTRDLTVNISRLIAIASSCYTLHPGDVIMTGTPDGVGPVMPGDEIVATIASLGEMRVSVRTGVASGSIHGRKNAAL